MEPDPAKWSVEEVQHFFQHDAPVCLPKYATEIQKASQIWSRTIVDHKLDGAALFRRATESFLSRRNFPSETCETAIAECVDYLKNKSKESSVLQHNSTIATPPIEHSPLPNLNNHKRPASPVSTAPLVVDKTANEDGVQKKKRRVQTLVLQPPPPEPNTNHKNRYMSSTLTVNNVFYGNTKIGAEINHVRTATSIQPSFILEPANNDETFQFIAGKTSQAESRFVWKRLKHFLLHQDPAEIRRDGRNAAYLLAYLPASSAHPSATVIRQNNLGAYIAVRESVLETTDGIRLSANDNQQGPEDEYSYLLVKYGGREDEEVSLLPTDSDDTQSLPSDAAGCTTSSGDDDDMAEESDDEAQLDATEAALIFQKWEQDLTLKWQQEKLPKLESKEARSVWKRMKDNKVMQGVLIQGTQALIARYEKRLATWRQTIISGNYRDKQELLSSVGSCEVTIIEILKHRWYIDVYNRRTMPAAPTSSKTKQRKAQASGTTHTGGNQLRLDQNDRFTPEPEQSPSEDIQSEELVAPVPAADSVPSVPHQSQELQEDDAPSASQGDFVAPDDSFGDAMELDDAQLDDTDAQSVGDNFASPRRHQDIAPKKAATPIKSSPLPKPPNDTDSDDDVLPDASEFVPARSKTSVIDVSSDTSTEVVAPRKKPMKKAPRKGPGEVDIHNLKPEDLTASQIEQLNFSTLLTNKDRRKMLLVLLYKENVSFRDWLRRCVSSYSQGELKKLLLTILRSEASGQRANVAVSDYEAVRSCAYIGVNYLYAKPAMLEAIPTPREMLDFVKKDMQVDGFCQTLRATLMLLTKSSTQRQSISKTGTAPSTRAGEEPIQISSANEETSDSEAANANSSKKKGKRRIKKDAQAARRRESARKRQEVFEERKISTQSQQSQPTTDSGGLLIQVNPNAEGHSPVYIEQHIAKNIREHQIEGVQFMWREITADTDETVKGCLLAHTMGLGKTMQSITVLISLFNTARSKDSLPRQLPANLRLDPKNPSRKRLRALILCPPALLGNWTREFRQWDTNRSLGTVFNIDDERNLRGRVTTFQQWRREGGVLLLGYAMFSKLVNEGSSTSKTTSADEQILRESACDLILKTADIAVLDEAQAIKNEKAKISNAVKRLTAQARIALTGTPLSNAVAEVYEILSWAAPGYLGPRNEFNLAFANPITKGISQDATTSERRKALKKLAVLRHEIEPKYLRAGVEVLKADLPPKVEYCLTLKLSSAQEAAYRRMVAALKAGNQDRKAQQARVFGWINSMTLLDVHPSLFRKTLLTPLPKRSEQPDAAESRSTSEEPTDFDADNELMPGLDAVIAAVDTVDPNAERYRHAFSRDYANSVVGEVTDDPDPTLSAKAQLFYDILQNTLEVGDKTLVFSRYLDTLDYFEAMLRSKMIPCYRIDGSTKTSDRMLAIEKFEKGRPGVMLITMKSGGVGLNIQCANRVVILDPGFVATDDDQAIGRAYRLGQSKPVYVYRFVVGGTFEENLENMQLRKKSLADRVVDKKDYKLFGRKMSDWLYDPKPVKETTDLSIYLGKDPVLDKILKKQVANSGSRNVSHVYAIKTHETFQAPPDDEPFNEEEVREVEEEKKATRRSTRLAARDGLLTTTLTTTTQVQKSTQLASPGPATIATTSLLGDVQPSVTPAGAASS